jgi:hypothetical protein
MTMWEALCKQVMSADGAGWFAAVACADQSPWSIRVMGISLAVLAASIAAAAVRRMRHGAEPVREDAKVPGVVMATLTDGFMAGWLAMGLIAVPLEWMGRDQ